MLKGPAPPHIRWSFNICERIFTVNFEIILGLWGSSPLFVHFTFIIAKFAYTPIHLN